ncbi:MAG: class I SAM-dependent methyltransferase [Dissulfurispiraceae bacterium]|jgi:SAM-dependent methyltransferase
MKEDKSTADKLREEIELFAKMANVHDLPAIFHYWSETYLRPKIQSLGFDNIDDIYVKYIKKTYLSRDKQECRILSVGAGNCDSEINLAQLLEKNDISNFKFTCLDINPNMLGRGSDLAVKAGLIDKFVFLETDINSWVIDNTYDDIIAIHSLHHFVELEVLFSKIKEALHPDGFFMAHDMIGRNGHMCWPETLEYVNAFWSLLDDSHKYNNQLKRFEPSYVNWDCSKEGFEGIRSQDILPLLINIFGFDLFLAFNGFMSVFTDRSFGHNFDQNNQWDKTFIDFVAKLDDYYIENGKIKPTQMVAVMTKQRGEAIRTYKHLTPEFCLRLPDGIEAARLPGKTISERLGGIIRRVFTKI